MSDQTVAESPRADTSPEAERVDRAILRQMGIERRAAMTFELGEELRRVTEAGIRHRHPEYNDDAIRLAVIRLWLGSELFRQVHPAVEIAL